MRSYKPRRAGKRWREGAPDYILDCFDDKCAGDRYTVFVTETVGEGDQLQVQYLGMNTMPTHPQHGISQWGALTAAYAARYRYRNGHHRVRWKDLPEHIREHVIARMATP